MMSDPENNEQAPEQAGTNPEQTEGHQKPAAEEAAPQPEADQTASEAPNPQTESLAAAAESPATPESKPPSLPGEPDGNRWDRNRVDLEEIRESVLRIKTEIRKVVIGQDEMIELLLAGLFTGGHILIEGVPGIAKTLTAKLLARSLSVDFSRIQFTPDLMPTDITGTSIFNLKSSEFTFQPGPIFSNVVLIDEVNRAPAKTQAALFEVMEEHQVTVDGTTHPMSFPFQVIATQNPIEQEGTYQLPEAQLDRFLFKVKIDYPGLEDEIAILQRFKDDFELAKNETINPVITAEQIQKCRKITEKIYIKDQLLNYIAQIVHETRGNGDLFLGASPRASLAILKASKAFAAMAGRDFVTPDDIQRAAFPVLDHRVVLSPDREMDGTIAEDVIKAIVKKIEVPR